MTKEWLDNPYRTIIEAAQMTVARGGTAIDSLNNLQKMMKESPVENEVAEKE